MIPGTKYFQASLDENLAPLPNQPQPYLQTADQNCLENIAVNICKQEKLGFKSFSYLFRSVCTYYFNFSLPYGPFNNYMESPSLSTQGSKLGQNWSTQLLNGPLRQSYERWQQCIFSTIQRELLDDVFTFNHACVNVNSPLSYAV